ncbi:hypothetical protein ALP76_01701 [Pseudomonas savastanoi pv. glycinea]|nr:hypothetical protein [Pseudomonas savastanoi pv. phaseolicola]MBN4175192.1 hypothetical protein [Pseudomonas savastanoi pv. phaseolicola]RMR97473.1 hypothetical protein ALP76_01701 [Pseudomonas savastanoi pv. glycinea]
MKKLPKYSPEVRERAIRMVFEHLPEYESQWATLSAIAPQDRLHARDITAVGSPI